MAYRADIEIAVRGAQQLRQLKDELNATARAVESVNNFIENFSDTGIVRSINTLRSAVSTAAAEFDKVALNTDEAVIAARQYIRATDELNNGLRERLRLIRSIEAADLAASRTIRPGDAGYGQQTPALPPAFIRAAEIRQGWNQFFRETADVARDLTARALNTRQSWNSFFSEAAKYSRDLVAKALNTRQSWNSFFSEAAKYSRDLVAKALNTRQSWNVFFAEASQISRDLRLRALNTKQSWNQFFADAQQERTRLQGGTGGNRRIGGAISSALIGGGFPLLFGQGGGAAAGGALGGLAGGLLGGGFGFALSIVGTAIGQATDDANKFNSELNKLNITLAKTSSNSITTAGDIDQLASRLGIAKDEAIKLVEAFSEFDSAAIRESLATSFGAFGGEAAFDALAAAIDTKSTLETIAKLRDEIGDTQAKEALKQLEINGAASANIFLQKRILQLQEQKLIKQAEEVTFWDRILAAAAQLGAQGQFIDPATFARERVEDLKKTEAEREKVLQQAIQDTKKFLEEIDRLNKKYTPGRQRKPPESRETQLRADFEAIVAIGKAEDRIRDLRFQGRDLLAVEEEKNKELYDIERDRIKALEAANYPQERLIVNKIAEARIVDATLRAEDKLRDIEQQRFEKQLQNKQAIEDAVQPIKDAQEAQKAQLEDAKKFNRLVMEGVLPAEAQRLVQFERLVADQLKSVEAQIAVKEAAIATAQAAIIEGKARGLNVRGLQEELDLLKAKRAALIGAATTGAGPAATPRERLEDVAGTLRGELNTLLDPVNQLVSAAEAISTAFSNSFKGIISGSLTAKEALANFFQSVADYFLDMAAQIIQKWIQMTILNSILKLFPGGGGGGLFAPSSGPLSGWDGSFSWMDTPMAKGGAFAQNGIMPFARGGIVNSPMLFPFANGGTTRMGLMGEAGPEAIMPLRRGADGRLGVEASGGGSMNVIVNVDAKGTSVQGNDQSGNQLGRAIAAAVQAELVKQKRPGGLLTT